MTIINMLPFTSISFTFAEINKMYFGIGELGPENFLDSIPWPGIVVSYEYGTYVVMFFNDQERIIPARNPFVCTGHSQMKRGIIIFSEA